MKFARKIEREMRVMPTIKMEVVDNSNLESVLYEDKK